MSAGELRGERRRGRGGRARHAGAGAARVRGRVRGRCTAHHLRHGRARALPAALDHAQVPPAALGDGRGVHPGQRGLPAGGQPAGRRGAAAGRRARGAGGAAVRALAALGVPHARSVAGLACRTPHWVLGAADAALVPALLARQRARAPHVAALLQAASSAAYALGPALGGLVAWWLGFETAMRALGVLNLLYAAHLYRALAAHPLSEQWGAGSAEEDSDGEAEGAPLAVAAPHYASLH
ncbi:unnamed protein product [Chrysodeixis includens]|uniref:MFS transporter n=1 Tax=Chrysodeixis includens TaxID=689277 RepID=A0A9N8L094_CHRIL|nr:unnamed protein product [Chrysodeixis includens]